MSSRLRSNNISNKLKSLPKTSGVYIFRDKSQKIIYVGKAVNLKNRVGSYFSGVKDPLRLHSLRVVTSVEPEQVKTRTLKASISNVEWVETGSEVGALFLESELIKRYKPRFNIELKDNKNFLY